MKKHDGRIELRAPQAEIYAWKAEASATGISLAAWARITLTAAVRGIVGMGTAIGEPVESKPVHVPSARDTKAHSDEVNRLRSQADSKVKIIRDRAIEQLKALGLWKAKE